MCRLPWLIKPGSRPAFKLGTVFYVDWLCSKTDEVSGKVAQAWKLGGHADRQREPRRLLRLERGAGHALLDSRLKHLSEACWPHALALDCREVMHAQVSAFERFDQFISRNDRILDCQIDADPSNGRHCVSRVPDTEQTRPVPALQSIHLHGQ